MNEKIRRWIRWLTEPDYFFVNEPQPKKITINTKSEKKKVKGKP